VALVLAACSAPPEDPCHRALDALDDAVNARVHGLTAADDIKQQGDWLQDARRCTGETGQARFTAHARALATRLGAVGAQAELLALARVLDGTPVATEARAMDLAGQDDLLNAMTG
jgi:hypothetical protein